MTGSIPLVASPTFPPPPLPPPFNLSIVHSPVCCTLGLKTNQDKVCHLMDLPLYGVYDPQLQGQEIHFTKALCEVIKRITLANMDFIISKNQYQYQVDWLLQPDLHYRNNDNTAVNKNKIHNFKNWTYLESFEHPYHHEYLPEDLWRKCTIESSKNNQSYK